MEEHLRELTCLGAESKKNLCTVRKSSKGLQCQFQFGEQQIYRLARNVRVYKRDNPWGVDKFSHPWWMESCPQRLRDLREPKLSTHQWPSERWYVHSCKIQEGGWARQKGKEREKLNIRMRVNRAGLKGILWKTCLQGGPLADIKEPGFCKDPTTLNDTSGLYWTPTLLLGVWNFDMCEAEGACVISPQQKAWGTKC